MTVGRCLSLAALMLTACGDPDPDIIRGSAIDHGRALFDDAAVAGTSFNSYACSTCHQPVATPADRLFVGAPLAGAVDRPSYWGGARLELLDAINDCLTIFMLKAQPWTGQEQQARAMYAYLASLPAEATDREPAPFTVVAAVEPALGGDPSAGAITYQRACAPCHGAAHSAAGRPIASATLLPQEANAGHPPPDYDADDRALIFVEKVRHGSFLFYDGTMPPLSAETLSDDELADIVAFLGPYD